MKAGWERSGEWPSAGVSLFAPPGRVRSAGHRLQFEKPMGPISFTEYGPVVPARGETKKSRASALGTCTRNAVNPPTHL